jgi:methionyl-tRNA formyltransferase
MDVVFFGSGAFGAPSLRALARHHTVRAVVTQPDRPAGRGGKLAPTPIADLTSSVLPGAQLIKAESVNTPEVRDHIRAIRADVWVVIAFGQKLSTSLLEGVFAINLHASLLPRWRGAAPINAAILAGDAETGNSVITLADRMDAGFVLAQSRRPINERTTAGELHDQLAEDGPALLLAVLSDFDSGALEQREQDESLVTIAPKLSRKDGWVDFRQAADECARRIRGLSPWPGVTVQVEGDDGAAPLKILRAQATPSESQQRGSPGELLDPARGLVRCKDSVLTLVEVQPPGKRAMPWADFARSRSPRRLIGRTES